MKKSLNFLALAAAATVLLSLPSAAKAQVAFGGTFRGPHGAFSIGVGGPFVPRVGAFVPSPYASQVYLTDDGYGFDYNSEWVPCTRYGSGWIIVQRPVFVQRPIVYGRGAYGYGSVRPFRSHARVYAFQGGTRFQGRREFDGRRDGGSSRDGNRQSDRNGRRGGDGRQ